MSPPKKNSRTTVTVLSIPVHMMNTMWKTLKIELIHGTVYIYLLSKKIIHLVVYCIKTVPWVHPASYTMDIGVFIGGKVAGAWH